MFHIQIKKRPPEPSSPLKDNKSESMVNYINFHPHNVNIFIFKEIKLDKF